MKAANYPVKNDQDLLRQVREELEWDPAVNVDDIIVEVKSGVVILKGRVESYAKKVAALEAVYRVPGVLDVANDIVVEPLAEFARRDAEIAEAIRHALKWDALIPHEKIRTLVSEGWVTLEGEVPSWLSREEADWVVWRVLGVRGVTNHITVEAPEVDPELLREKLEDALERRAYREADRIRIDVQDSKVTVTGQVHSLSEKRAVLGTIGSTRGIRKVEDRIVIDPYL